MAARPRRHRPAPSTPLAEREAGPGNPVALGDALAGLLDRLGVASAVDHDSVEAVLAAELERRGHRAHLVGLRHGVLTLQADDPYHARLLYYDLDNLRDVLTRRVPTTPVERLVVRSAPPRS